MPSDGPWPEEDADAEGAEESCDPWRTPFLFLFFLVFCFGTVSFISSLFSVAFTDGWIEISPVAKSCVFGCEGPASPWDGEEKIDARVFVA